VGQIMGQDLTTPNLMNQNNSLQNTLADTPYAIKKSLYFLNKNYLKITHTNNIKMIY